MSNNYIKIKSPSREETRSWITKHYGYVYWRGEEIPFWDTKTRPPVYKKAKYYAIDHWEDNHMRRADLVFEKNGIVWLCETDPFPLYNSIGQLIAAKYWLPKCYPRVFEGKRIRMYLFCHEDRSIVRKSARHAGIRTIILKKKR